MRPTIDEERAHAIADQLDDWQLSPDERRSLEALLATPWRRNGPFVAAAFFGLTVFAMFALVALCKSTGATEFTAAAIAIAGGEYLILRRRMYGSGIESALWIGGLLAFIAGLPRSGDPEAMLVIAAAFGIAAWRMQNAIFGAIGVIFLGIYFAVAWHGSHDYWRAAMVPLAVAVIAVVAKRWIFFRPWLDSFWSLVAIVMPLVAEIGGRIVAYDSAGHLEYALTFLVLGSIALLAGLHLRDHALLIAAGVSFAINAFELHDRYDPPLEWELILGGLALLAIAAVVARLMRGRTTGLVATPARLTRYDELVKLGGTMVAGQALQPHPAAPSDPAVTGTEGGAGSFGGGGATGDY
jgi:hypothetical protein